MTARAKTLDGEIVEGYYLIMGTQDFIYENIIHKEVVAINPDTLEYKIGDEWHSMEELEMMAEYDKHMRVVRVDNGGQIND